MSLRVCLDAQSYMPTKHGWLQTVKAKDIWGRGTKTNVLLDPYTGCISCKPIQLQDDWETLGTVTRYPIANWTGDTTHWDDILASGGSGNGIINSDFAAGKITTSATFETNTSFLVSFNLCGTDNDRTSGIVLEFGQWKLKLSTSGDAILSRLGTTRFADIITDPIPDKLVEFVIMPYVNNSLLIRRINGNNSGMLVVMNSTDDITEMNADPPVIIQSAAFSVTPVNVAVKQFSLTELTYDTDADYELISQVLTSAQAPTAAQTFYSTDDGLTNYGGGIGVALWEETTDTAFIPDSIKHRYRAAFILTPLAHKTPFTRGLTFGYSAEARTALPGPADITNDVRTLEINVDKEASQTEALIEIRNPENYDLFGACSRFCTIEIDGNIILNGILSEPPVYTYSKDGDEYYSIRIEGLYRYLKRATIVNECVLDGLNHVYVMQTLCEMAGITDQDLIVETTTDLVGQSTATDNKNNFEVKFMDLADIWVKRICEETGWILTDDISGGVYNLKYCDPLSMTTIPSYIFHTQSSGTTADNQKIQEWAPYSLEPECNIFVLTYCNESGDRCMAVYYDSASPDYLGQNVYGGFDIGQCTDTKAAELCLRIGPDVTRRIDMVRFSADWPVKLWTNDVVTIVDDETNDWANYRIKTMSMKSVSEIDGREIRNCDCLAEKLV